MSRKLLSAAFSATAIGSMILFVSIGGLIEHYTDPKNDWIKLGFMFIGLLVGAWVEYNSRKDIQNGYSARTNRSC